MTQDLDTFREEARAWLDENFPPALKGQRPPGIAGFGAKFTDDWKAWQEQLGEKGWSTPTWPQEYGGGGLSPEQAAVLREEMKRAGAIYAPRGRIEIRNWDQLQAIADGAMSPHVVH